MVRQRISDIWGGNPRLGGQSSVRWVVAVLLALPLSCIGFAIADNPHTPAVARLLIAPGYVAAFHLPIYGGGFLNDVGRFGMSALAMNVCYYTAVMLGLMRVWRERKRKTRPNE